MYELMKMRLTQGGYACEDARARVDYLVAAGRVTPEQAQELTALARAKADVPSAVELDVAEAKQAAWAAAAMLSLMRPAVQHVAAETYSDDELVNAAELFDVWGAGAAYRAGTVLRHGEMLYRVMQDVTAQAHQAPDAAGMLAVYAPVQAPVAEAGQVLPWVSGETGIAVGDRREHKGVVYECVQAPGANTWEPGMVPALWKAVV